MQLTGASGDMGLNASEKMRRMSGMSQEKQVAEVAGQFEAIFIRQFLNESLKPMIGGALGGNIPGSDIYRSMMVDTLADGVQKGGGMGLQSVIQLQLMAGGRGTARNAGNNEN